MVASNEAYVTLVTSDDYGVGALVLGHSLKDSKTTRKIVVMVTDRVTPLMQGRLKDVFDEVVVVDPIRSTSAQNLNLLGRPDLYWTFTKLHAWTLTRYSKLVFLDADTLILRNVDELFDQPEFSACPDIGWPDCFNSGVFVLKPSKETFYKLVAFGEAEGSFDGGDQGLLNDYFRNWNRLSFLYNVTPSASYSYAPAYQKFGNNIAIVHFIGSDKPWTWDRVSFTQLHFF
jgi:glycogenin